MPASPARRAGGTRVAYGAYGAYVRAAQERR